MKRHPGKEPRKGRKPESYDGPPGEDVQPDYRIGALTSFVKSDGSLGSRIMIRDNTQDSGWAPLQARRAAREGVLTFTGETRLTSQMSRHELENFSDIEIARFSTDRGQSLIQVSLTTGQSGFGELIAYPREDVPKDLHVTMPAEPACIVVDRCRVNSDLSHIGGGEIVLSAAGQSSAFGQAQDTQYPGSNAEPPASVTADDIHPAHQATASGDQFYSVPGGWISDPAVGYGTGNEPEAGTQQQPMEIPVPSPLLFDPRSGVASQVGDLDSRAGSSGTAQAPAGESSAAPPYYVSPRNETFDQPIPSGYHQLAGTADSDRAGGSTLVYTGGSEQPEPVQSSPQETDAGPSRGGALRPHHHTAARPSTPQLEEAMANAELGESTQEPRSGSRHDREKPKKKLIDRAMAKAGKLFRRENKHKRGGEGSGRV